MGAFLNYTDQQGIVMNTYNKRLNAKVAYDANPTTWLSTAVNLLVNHTWGRYTPEDGGGQDARRTMIEMVPWYPVRDMDGKYTTSTTSMTQSNMFGLEGMSNPVMILEKQKRMRYNTQIFGNMALTFHLLDGLDLKTQLGIDSHQRTYKEYSARDLNNISMQQQGRAEINHTNTLYWQEETYLTYNKVFGEHRLNAMAGLSWQERTRSYDRSYTEGFSDDFYEENNMQVGTNPSAPESDWNRWAMNSYFLRFAYTYKDRYSATVTARVDGSSKFGENNKYAFFPSAGLAWNISQEDFLKDSELISNLKLHTSYGLTGNSEIDPYKSLANVDAGTDLLDGKRGPWSYINTMGNPDLKWEKTGQFDVGFNLGLFQNRLNFDISYYNKKTTDLLLDCPLPHATGFSSVFKNIGSVRNQGLDIMINGTPVQTHDFTWSSTLNLNYNKNEITELFNGRDEYSLPDYGLQYKVGHSVGELYFVRRAGVDPRDGKQIWYDKDGNLTKVYNKERDAVLIGKDRYAPLNGGFGTEFSWKGISVSADFTWAGKKYLISNDRFFIENAAQGLSINQSTNMLNIWTKPGQITDIPASTEAIQMDDHLVENASFLRLKNVTVQYELPKSILKHSGVIERFNIFFTGRNLWTLTNFTGYDPEPDINLIKFGYPNTRQFVFGVELTF